MGKKRKTNGRQLQKAEPEELGSARRLITTYEDVADSEDEFHINRDKVLLDDGPERKRQRRLQEDDAFLEGSEEEVLDFDEGLEETSDSNDGSDLDAGQSPDLGKRSASHQLRPGERDASASEAEEAMEGWGTSKKEYYDADIIETEADALEEEAEAIRIQRQHLQSMAEADFGFDETEWLTAGVPGDDTQERHEGVISEVLPDLQLIESMSVKEKEELLGLRYPEFRPLAEEFLALRSVHDQLAKTTTKAREAWDKRLGRIHEAGVGELDGVPLPITRFMALSIYLGCLAMYFAIFTSGPCADGRATPRPPKEMREHPIMESLIKCRTLWHQVRDLQMDEASMDGEEQISNKEPASKMAPDSQAVLAEETDDILETVSERKATSKSKALVTAERPMVERDTQSAEHLRRTEEEIAKLGAEFVQASQGIRPKKDSAIKLLSDDSDLGEENAPTPRGDAANTKRKKSLQFYTSQIAQKLNRRETAGRDAGGDADIPYRERLKDRQARLLAQAEVRSKKTASSAGVVLGGESDEEDRTAAQEIRADGGELDLYDQAARQTKQKKAEKATRAAAHREAEEQGASVRFVEEVDADGKRAIGYKIEKNKGLTPKRRKDVRNARVKKRNKYEEKMKKLGSMRPVYKGGEGRGGYGGELTGIKTNLVRSVKF